jgi:hypothetical protein
MTSINIIENNTTVEIPASNIIEILENNFFVTIAEDNSVTVQEVINSIQVGNQAIIQVSEELVNIIEIGIQGPEGPPGIGGPITLSGDVTGSGTTSIITTLANSGVTAGVYGSSNLSAVVTVDDKGRVTNMSTVIINHPTITWAAALANGRTTSGYNPQVTAGDELQFRDSGLTIDSPVDGEMEITADAVLTLTAPTVDIGGGFRVDLPASGGNVPAFYINTPGSPGIYFHRPTAASGKITFEWSGVAYHDFGLAAAGTLGDVTHTDGTNTMHYDAQNNILSVSNSRGSIQCPSMTTTQRNSTSPSAGAIIFNTTTSKHEGYDGAAWNALY